MLSFLCLSLNSYAQKISVVDFRIDLSDLTANSTSTQVLDQNGEKCALIRVQTTQKGFIFDVGSLGVQKVDDTHVGEIWVYVPFGVRHISIRHPQLGSLSGYDFPIQIQKARTYILEISHDKIFVNKYDDTRKQTLNIKTVPNAYFTLNGAGERVGQTGTLTKELSFGTYTYKIEVDRFFPIEGQVEINDEHDAQELVITDFRPRMGKLIVRTEPQNAVVHFGDKIISATSSDPYELQIGSYTITVSAPGHKAKDHQIEITENESTQTTVTLSREDYFDITSKPSGAKLVLNGEDLGKTPVNKLLTSGSYKVQAYASGYKDYDAYLDFDCADPKVNIALQKIYNYKNSFYLGVSGTALPFISVGATLGFYLSNVNIEASYQLGFGESDVIYWNKPFEDSIRSSYSPNMLITGKIGYALPVGIRMRITPQLGYGFLKLKEQYPGYIADGAYLGQVLADVQFTYAVSNLLSLSICPEYRIAINPSKGYSKLSNLSPIIKSWGQGFSLRFGVNLYFNL